MMQGVMKALRLRIVTRICVKADLTVCEHLQKAERLSWGQVKVEVVAAIVCGVNERPEVLLFQRYDGLMHCHSHLWRTGQSCEMLTPA